MLVPDSRSLPNVEPQEQEGTRVSSTEPAYANALPLDSVARFELEHEAAQDTDPDPAGHDAMVSTGEDVQSPATPPTRLARDL